MQFLYLLKIKEFVEKFGEIKGEKNKRIPKEFQEVAEELPLIANKSFYYVTELSQETIYRDDLADLLMDYWKVAQPVKDFLHNTIKP